MRARLLFVGALGLVGSLAAAASCSVAFPLGGYGGAPASGGGPAATTGSTGGRGGGGHAGGGATGGASGSGGGKHDAGPKPCPCTDGDGSRYCGADAYAQATADGCDLGIGPGHESAALSCVGGVWSVFDACTGSSCARTAGGWAYCSAPGTVCDCWINNGDYCGFVAENHASMSACVVPLSVDYPQELLVCVAGVWDVAQLCANGCMYNSSGPDFCK